MSRYGSINDAGPRSRLPRFATLSFVCTFLLGCGGRPATLASSDPIVDIVAAGDDAFRAGDQAALQKNIQALADRLPADETQGAFATCSSDRQRLREIEKAKRKLEYLAASPAISMGEAERYVYFEALVDGRVQTIDERGRAVLALSDPYDPLNPTSLLDTPSDFECESSSTAVSSADPGKQEAAIQVMERDRLRDWLISLRRTLDTQLRPQLRYAAVELSQNGLRTSGDWTPPDFDDGLQR